MMTKSGSLFDVARQYRESFDAYGSKKSFEWQQVENEEPVIHTRGLPEPEIPTRVKVPDFAQLLPGPIQRFTTKGVYGEGEEHLSFTQGGGHGGSHPHLVHAWLSAIRGERPALPDAETSANWTMVGICAHESAMKGGEKVEIPTSLTVPCHGAGVLDFTPSPDPDNSGTASNVGVTFESPGV